MILACTQGFVAPKLKQRGTDVKSLETTHFYRNYNL